MATVKRIEIKTQAIKAEMNDKIRKKISNDIDKIGGNVWKKNEHHRAYFPDSIIDLFDDCKLLLSAYIDLNTGEFVAETTEKEDWNGKTNRLTDREYWERCRDYMIKN